MQQPQSTPPHGKCPQSSPQSHCAPTTRCPPEVTALLQVCQESRNEALRQYQPLLAPNTPKPSLLITPLFYFDSANDGIFVDTIWPWLRVSQKPTGVFETRQLSIHCNAWWSAWKRASTRKVLLGERAGLLAFRNLEKLVIVFRVEEKEKEKEKEKGDLRAGIEMGMDTRISGLDASMMAKARRRRAYAAAAAESMKCELDFPAPDVDIEIDAILHAFGGLKERDRAWKVPELKLMAWAAARPDGDGYGF